MITTTTRCCGPLCKGKEVDALFFGKNQKACKSCIREYSQRRYAAKRDEILAYNRKYKADNREAMNQYNRDWYADNPGKASEYNKRYLSRPRNHLIKNMGRRIHTWTGVNPSRTQIMEYLGCSIENWMAWLASKFTPGMGWKNYGSGVRAWEIDHYMPLSRWDKSDPEQIKRALHYTNTRPLWAKENRAKGAKLPELPLAA